VPEYHPYRHPQNKKHFENKVEYKSRPQMPTTESGFAHGAQGNPSKHHGVKRRSILYDLPYLGVSILLFL
jgi:hypothetical protein